MGRAKEQLDSTIENTAEVCVKCGEKSIDLNESLICEDCVKKIIDKE